MRGVPLISPVLAFLYKPLGSRCSTISNGASTKTSTNASDDFSCSSRTSARSEMYGEIKAVMVIAQASVNSFATWSKSARGSDKGGSCGIHAVPRRSFGCSRFSTFRRTRGPCSAQTERYRHRACTRTCPGAAGVAPTHKRWWTEFFMSYRQCPGCIDLPLTFPLALRPVSQMVTPLCFRSSTRSDGATEPGWKVMLVAMVQGL